MKQVRGNPTSNFNITVANLTITGTDDAATVTVSGGAGDLVLGQSVILSFSGGTAQGYTNLQEYYVIPVDATTFKIADSKEDAFNGTAITTTGDAGGGTVYPIYRVGGILVVNTAGNVYIRGLNNNTRGTTSFSLQTVESNGTLIPFMIKDFTTYQTTADDFVVWQD